MADDDLSPTDISQSKNVITSEFNKVENRTSQENKEQPVEVPDMIKNHGSQPVFKPPWDTSPIDRESFDNNWQREEQKYKQNDPFEKTDREKEQAQQRDQNRGDRGRE